MRGPALPTGPRDYMGGAGSAGGCGREPCQPVSKEHLERKAAEMEVRSLTGAGAVKEATEH